MKWQIFVVLICAIIISAAAFFLRTSKKSLENKYTTEVLVLEESSYGGTLEEKAYKVGYERGQRAMLSQMGKLESSKVAKYTVDDFEVQEEDKERFEQIMSKAYVEGYHRAADTFSCPRDRSKE